MRRGRLFAALGLGVLAILALPATPAAAHAGLVRTSPVQGSVVQDAPAQVTVTFSERVTAVPGRIQVLGPDGRRVDKGSPSVVGNDLRIPVRTDVPRGTYLVSYRVISADSHPVGAGFTYSVGAPSAVPPKPNDAAGGRTDPVVASVVTSAAYLGYAGLILLAGPTLVLAALWPTRLPRRAPTRLAYLGIGAIGLAAVVELLVQAQYDGGGGLFSASAADLGEVLTGTAYGRLHLLRLAVLGASVPLLRLHLADRGGRPVRVALVLLGIVGVATWPLSGHPGTTPAPLLTIVADAAHLTSMAVWLGGLVMLLGFLLRRANTRELDAILPVWSNWAALAVTVLVLAGTAQAIINVATLEGLLHTEYGLIVSAKVLLLTAVLVVASVSRRIVNRQGDRRRLRTAVFVEVAGAVLILGLTSVLVRTTPAVTAVASRSGGGTGGNIYATTLDCKLYQLQLDIEPLSVGNSDVHLYAYTPDGAPLAVKEWKVSAALPSAGVQPIDVPVLALTPSHATGTVSLPAPGQWQFSFTLRTTDFDEATVTTVVTIG
jgi:copper transport protein